MSKIYQLITSVQLGGAENVAFDLAEHCGSSLGDNIEITVLELYPTQNSYVLAKKEELASRNISIITLHEGSKRMSLMFAPFSLVRLIRKARPSVIHSHTDLPDFVLSIAMRICSIFRIPFPKIVRTIHNTQLWRTHDWMGKITESAFKNDWIAAVSSYAMVAYEQLRKKYGLPISPIRQIIYNGRAVPPKCPIPFPIDKEKINIAFCGRFEDYKGMETLIPTIKRIGQMYPGRFAFHLIGDGTYKKQLKKLSHEQSHVFLHGSIPNASTLFHAFDYLFMPSHFEGLALISIEASFSGLPVIASIAPGLDETLPEKWPLKFHLDNKEELLAIFDGIVNNVYNKSELKKMARDYVDRKFSLKEMINSYNNLYTDTL